MSTWEERMSARARARREAEEAAERERARVEEAAERAEWGRRAEHQRMELLAQGRPCEACYLPEPVLSWRPYRTYDGPPWEWAHGEPVGRKVVHDDWGDLEYCTHPCHGDEPHPMSGPLIAFG